MADVSLGKEKVRQVLDRVFVNGVPHNVSLGIQLVDFASDFFELRLPWSERIVGNPDTGVIHGGAVTSLMDGACGGAVMVRLGRPMRVATLDLRIDYLRPGEKGQDIVCRAECYRITKHVAFTRAIAHDGNPDDPIASAAGTFIIFREKS